jgi:hypothetical protein
MNNKKDISPPYLEKLSLQSLGLLCVLAIGFSLGGLEGIFDDALSIHSKATTQLDGGTSIQFVLSYTVAGAAGLAGLVILSISGRPQNQNTQAKQPSNL